MASIIKLKRSTSGGAIPSSSSLQAGELAVNLADKVLFTSTNGTDIVRLSGDLYNLVTVANTSHTFNGADIVLTVDNDTLANDVISLIGSATVNITRNSNGSITFTAASAPSANTADRLTTSRNIELTGHISGDVDFDGSADVDIVTTIGTDVVENSMILNDHIAIAANTGSTTDFALGETISIVSGTATGITTVVSANTITISGVDASTTVKGVAKYDSGDFSTSSGTVSLANSVNGAVLALNGTSSEITVSRTNGIVTVGLPDDVTITGQLNVSENIVVTGNTQIGGNLVVDGDLTVEGALTYISSSTVNVDDSMLKLAANNSADTIDSGVYALYIDGVTDKYSGYFRDASDGIFKFYKDLETEPTQTVNTSGTGYVLAQVDAVIDGGTY